MFGDTETECATAFNALLDMLKDLQVSVAPHKLKFPSQRQTWLGIEIDTREGHACFRVGASRIARMEFEMAQFYTDYRSASHCDPRRLASLIGRCGFLSQIVPDGHVHMRRLYDVSKFATIDWVSGEVLHMWGSKPVPWNPQNLKPCNP